MVNNKEVVKFKLETNLFVLLFADLLTLFFFIKNNNSVSQVMLIYATQDLILVLFYYKKVRKSHEISEMLDKKKMDKFAIKAINYRTANEQFFYLFAITLPVLICTIFILSSIYIGVGHGNDQSQIRNISLGSTGINYYNVAVVLAIFIMHHYYSYRISLAFIKQQKSRFRGYSLIPYKKLMVRLIITYTITLVCLPLYVNFGAKGLFILLFLLKTIVDLLLSNTYRLLSQKNI